MTVRTTVVGSWWWPEEHSAALREYHDGKLGPAEGERVLTACATAAIAEQRAMGLTEWTGGEYFTDNFVDHLQRAVTGIEIEKPSADEVFDYDDLALARVVGPVAAPNGLGYAEAYRRENALPGGVPKATVVSPLEVLPHTVGRRRTLTEHLPELLAIVNQELRALADAGCPHVVLDAPALGVNVNMGRMTADEAADLIAPCFEGVNARRGVHICNGNLKGRPSSGVLRNAPWVPILQRLDGVIDVAAIECKYFTQWLDREAFRDLPASMELAAGIVDEGNYWVEPVEKIRSRAEDWARVVGEERLWLSPSCGFGRHPARDQPVLKEKVANMVEAAALV